MQNLSRPITPPNRSDGELAKQYFYEQVWQGARAVDALSRDAPTQELIEAAKLLSTRLNAGLGGPRILFRIASKGESAVTEYEAAAMEAFISAATQLPPEYGQPAFQCLEDFEKSKRAGTHPFICGLVLAICLAERLIPKKVEYVSQEKVIQIGNRAQISAPIVIADKIENSFNTLMESTIDESLRSLLDDLLKAVIEVNQKIPTDKAEYAESMARDAETLVKEATSSKPRRLWYEVSLEGLKQGAINIGKLADPVLAIVNKLWSLLLT